MLYDPARSERDACGIGFVADEAGSPSRSLVAAALDALARLKHRGALAADARTGDGAGLLLPLPRHLLTQTAPGHDPARAGIAMVFLDPEEPEHARALVERALCETSLIFGGWRAIPVDEGALGDGARSTLPVIEQATMLLPAGCDLDEGERRAFRARRAIERLAREEMLRVYPVSVSFRTITYKALCAADRLADFYIDLADERTEAWFALFHSRYSTNTAPTWERAQPFRFLAHNGEINTIKGNVAAMRARERELAADGVVPEEDLRPAIDASSSDSGMLDEALELITRGGRGLIHAATMLVPPAWEGDTRLPPHVHDFFRFHSCLIEPWDGPAGLVFADGLRVGAMLDRNGLRPLRVAVCEDGFVAVASEAGAVDTNGHGHVERTRLGPGEILCVDPAAGGLIRDAAVKERLARRRPFGDWIRHHLVTASPGDPVERAATDVTRRQVAAGFSKEEMTVVLRPMAIEGREPTSSMGDDTAQPPLATYARPVFSFFKQRFAQVTNPAMDHLRERHVMSLTTRLGRRAPLLAEMPEAAALRDYASFLLFPSGVAELESLGAVVLDATFDLLDGPDGLRPACSRLAEEAEAAVRAGAEFLVLTDRGMSPDRVAVPSALAAGAVHHHLVRSGLRFRAGLVVDADDPRETHHFGVLLTNGADMICPRLVFDSIAGLAAGGRLGGGVSSGDGQRNFAHAVEEGVLKVMSKMGIATVDSYRGAQVIEAIGLGSDVIEMCFPGVSSPLGGLSFVELGADAVLRHGRAYGAKPQLVNLGIVKHKSGGEAHALDPEVVGALREAAAGGDEAAAHELRRAVGGDRRAYERFAAIVNGRSPMEPRDLLEPVAAGPAIPIDEVEAEEQIVRRFSSGAMSHGALSAEAHETVARAFNLLGAEANSGEGGEAPERYRDERNCGIKQVASGRFGVTPSYLVRARELQIKIAQGSKPGEGGQLPATKVSVEIARLRHTVPGIGLISPPPHHDIYSIEDLAQLVFDLKQANPQAAVSVKLVASEGIGTIAAGVVKALADVVHIAGGDGGTGASPLSSIKNAGLPWEVGLAETQQALSVNGLRGRARLRVDGGLKTGRDIVVAALLGADEFSFGTALLVAEGCILVRTCHRNTCPVGIATQDPSLRARFAGTPEQVAAYLLMVAGEVRRLLADLGLRSLGDAVGRTDLLSTRITGDARRDSLDLRPLLAPPGAERSHVAPVALQRPRSPLGDRVCEDALGALAEGRLADNHYEITTADRAVGARLGALIADRFGGDGAPAPVRARFEGSAGQSFGAFLSAGVEMILTGEANDYVCKGMAGGKVVIRPPAGDAGRPTLAGNTVLYGATGGSLFIAGRAGERFAVRNSGAVAVVEGTGDHACEYMTGGAVVILGPTGNNLGAGMSGGEIYVFDPLDELEGRLNRQLVAAYAPTRGQLESLRRVLGRHHQATGSPLARQVLHDWKRASKAFRRVAPVAEVARLEALFEGAAA
ncbi:MAG TPA: glutamate synthase large subunit [Actinomycetota bacterium]|nr:glutamate synthase large subunit [Actinomycetota bacterium]